MLIPQNGVSLSVLASNFITSIVYEDLNMLMTKKTRVFMMVFQLIYMNEIKGKENNLVLLFWVC